MPAAEICSQAFTGRTARQLSLVALEALASSTETSANNTPSPLSGSQAVILPFPFPVLVTAGNFCKAAGTSKWNWTDRGESSLCVPSVEAGTFQHSLEAVPTDVKKCTWWKGLLVVPRPNWRSRLAVSYSLARNDSNVCRWRLPHTMPIWVLAN